MRIMEWTGLFLFLPLIDVFIKSCVRRSDLENRMIPSREKQWMVMDGGVDEGVVEGVDGVWVG